MYSLLKSYSMMSKKLNPDDYTISLKRQKILGIAITENSREEILEEVKKYLQLSKYPIVKSSNKIQESLTIVTPNPEQIVCAQKDKHFAGILNQADIALPDGIGITWASRLLSPNPIQHRIPGVEFMEELVSLCAEKGYRVGLIGGRVGVAVRALECLRKKYNKLVGWGKDGPETRIVNCHLHIDNWKEKTEIYFADLGRKINENNTRVVFIGLGAPKQEYLIEQLSKQLTINNYQLSTILMSVGGSFDIITGKIPRAPTVLRTLGLEWLWRLLRQPWRLRRQLTLIRFATLVLQSRIVHTTNI